MGRHSHYTPEIAERICEEISTTDHGLITICAHEGMPSRSMVYRWLQEQPEFLKKFTVAKELQADHMAEQIIAISDDGSSDYVEREDGTRAVDHDHIARSRLRVDSRKWLASKLAPKKYGDRVDATVSGPNGGPAEFVVRLVKSDGAGRVSGSSEPTV